MTFAISGSTITQTDTDTNLSGLAGIAGVTTMVVGERTIYDVGANLLNIGGTLTSNARAEGITSTAGGNALRVLGGGALTINDSYNGHYYEDLWFGSFTDNAVFLIDPGGALTMNGGYIATDFVTANENWADPATISMVINHGRMGTMKHGGSVFQTDNFTVRTRGLDIVGRLILSGIKINPPVDFADYYRNITFEPPTGHQADHGVFSAFLHKTLNADRPYRNFATRGANVIFTPWQDNVALFRNTERGTEHGSTPFADGFSPNSGTFVVDKEFRVRVRDTLGAPVEGATVYVGGTDHGNLAVAHGLDLTILPEVSVLTDVAGETGVEVLRLGAHSRFNNSVTRRSYGKYNNTSDIFDLGVVSYAHLPRVEEHIFKGFDVLTIERALVDDPMITEPDRAVVDAYGAIDNVAQFYDAAKAWLVDNYTGQPAPLATKNNGVITSPHDVVVDANAAQAFAFDGATITIKTDDFVGVITAPTVTTLNGATISTTMTTVAEIRTALLDELTPDLEALDRIAALHLNVQHVDTTTGVMTTRTGADDADSMTTQLLVDQARAIAYNGDNGPISARGATVMINPPFVDPDTAITENQDLTVQNVRQGIRNELEYQLSRVAKLHDLSVREVFINETNGTHEVYDNNGTIISTAQIFSDGEGTVPYSGGGKILSRGNRS